MIFNKHSIGILLTCGLTLSGCETATSEYHVDANLPLSSLNAKRQVQPAVTYAFKLLEEEKYHEASKFINSCLQSQPKSIIFHLLNGLAYEKLAELGDASGTELAEVGYQNAINIEPNNVFALIQLGKLKYRQQQYPQAQEHFANALLLKPNDPVLWHELAAASYYAYDIKTALSAIRKAEKLKPEDPLIHRSASMIYASLGDFNAAKKHFVVFQSKAGNDPAVDYVSSRFNEWQALYKSGRVKLASAKVTSSGPGASSKNPPASPLSSPPSPNAPGSESQGQGQGQGQGGQNMPDAQVDGGSGDSSENSLAQESKATTVLEMPFGSEGAYTGAGKGGSAQIIVDCYLLRITEDAITSKGNNILENLAVTLSPGGFAQFKGHFWGGGAPTFDAGNSQTSNNLAYTAANGFRATQNSDTGFQPIYNPSNTIITLNNRGSVSGQVFASGISWAGLTYNLNIANAIDSRTEVVSRPSLMTFLNKQSVFFSGDELINGFTGQYGGTLVKYPVGVTLEITPQSLEGDLLTLDIGVEGSILTSPAPNLQETVTVGKTRVDTHAKMRLGETLMLGGIYERLDESSKNGFPGLQDVPLVQYFFSNEKTLSRRRSIVFMLTPRSPDAVKSAVNRAMTREAVEPHLAELIARNPNWFSTDSNLVAIFRYLSTDPLIYYEFRSGDILPPSWGWEPTTSSKLQQLSNFLYY